MVSFKLSNAFFDKTSFITINYYFYFLSNITGIKAVKVFFNHKFKTNTNSNSDLYVIRNLS